MARIILVDDSASARALLSARLTAAGHLVEDVATAAEAVERALAKPPNAVVTDLWMPGISGLQLCRLLRAEPTTSHVPILLVTATEERRSRFWARRAGATVYLTKAEADRLVAVLADIPTIPPPPLSASIALRGTVPERLSQLLDIALFESTIAGEVRALAQSADDIEKAFAALAALASDVIGYRWLALSIVGQPRLFVHSHAGLVEAAEREARDALGVQAPPERRQKKADTLHMLADDRAVESEWSSAPIVEEVHFGRSLLATIALGPGRRGASIDDRSFLSLLARELGGPVQMIALVAAARRLANTDSLTGLLNRRAFVEAVVAGRARMTPLSLLLLDIDHFKKVNDTRGHDAGDAVLRGVAKVLGAMGRRSDLVARWGGEEFVVALAQTSEPGARVAAERVRRAIAETDYELPNGDFMNATASIGLVTETGDAWELDEVLSRADKAMYAAKSRGRNRVEVL